MRDVSEPARTIGQRQIPNGDPTADPPRRRFVPREVVERILRETPFDLRFERDVADALDDRSPDSPYDRRDAS